MSCSSSSSSPRAAAHLGSVNKPTVQNSIHNIPRNPRHHRRQPRERIDFQLDAEGLYRKRIPRDGSSLFRVVAEQIFNIQIYYKKVRAACVRFMERHREEFENLVAGNYEEYLENLKLDKTPGTKLEMMALSNLYEREFFVYFGERHEPENITKNYFEKKVLLFHGGGDHYDSICSKEELTNAGIAQALVYEILYGKVFGMGDSIDSYGILMLNPEAAENLDRSDSAMSNEKCEAISSGSETRKDQVENANNGQADSEQRPLVDPAVRESYAAHGPPFPYKVVKSFQSHIYRNVPFDMWLEEKKEINRMNSGGLYGPGIYLGATVKVAYRNDRTQETHDEIMHGWIQALRKDHGDVWIYLLEKKAYEAVPFSWIEVIPKSAVPPAEVPNEENLTPPQQQISQSTNFAGSENSREEFRDFPRMIFPQQGKPKRFQQNLRFDVSNQRANFRQAKKPSIPQFSSQFRMANQPSSSSFPWTQQPQPTLIGGPVFLPQQTTTLGQVYDSSPSMDGFYGLQNPTMVQYIPCIQPVAPPAPLMIMTYPYANTTGFFRLSPFAVDSVQIPFPEHLTHQVNWACGQSIALDFSDLPTHDWPSLRFFYNAGVHCVRAWNDSTYRNSQGTPITGTSREESVEVDETKTETEESDRSLSGTEKRNSLFVPAHIHESHHATPSPAIVNSSLPSPLPFDEAGSSHIWDVVDDSQQNFVESQDVRRDRFGAVAPPTLQNREVVPPPTSQSVDERRHGAIGSVPQQFHRRQQNPPRFSTEKSGQRFLNSFSSSGNCNRGRGIYQYQRRC